MNAARKLDLPIPYRLADRPASGPGLAKCTPASEYQPMVDAFGSLMLAKCLERRKKHGTSYRTLPVREHLSWLRAELAELEQEIDRLEYAAENDPEEERAVIRRLAVGECVDVANLAMFIARTMGMGADQ